LTPDSCAGQYSCVGRRRWSRLIGTLWTWRQSCGLFWYWDNLQ